MIYIFLYSLYTRVILEIFNSIINAIRLRCEDIESFKSINIKFPTTFEKQFIDFLATSAIPDITSSPSSNLILLAQIYISDFQILFSLAYFFIQWACKPTPVPCALPNCPQSFYNILSSNPVFFGQDTVVVSGVNRDLKPPGICNLTDSMAWIGLKNC